MQAALTAKRQGWEVTLLEKRPQLGGLFSLAPATPGKEAMEKPLRSMVRAVKNAEIHVRTEVEASIDEILALDPDHVIVATGSRPAVPPIPGLGDVFTAEDVITGERETGQNVLVLGGGLVGIEMAEMLATQGREVLVIEMLEDIARDMEPVTRKMTLRRLQELPVKIHTSTRLARMDGGEAFAVAEGSTEETPLGVFDSVLVAVGHHSYDPLSQGLEEAGVPVSVIGDAARPGQILDATRGGYAAVFEGTEPGLKSKGTAR
jgi:pyruvate/2-oxoglutarate dehydrogenase complex dihydrolipoamide dehydrogenase (E3) component